MLYVGIDVGGESIKSGLVDPDGLILDSDSHVTVTAGHALLVDQLVSIVKTYQRHADVRAIGLGIPGLRSSDTGQIQTSPNIPALDQVNLESLLEARIKIPVTGRNDADMHAWGEFRKGAARGTRHMMCLTLGTGVGSGLILDGTLFGGARGYAGEVGHMVVDPGGAQCGCGGRGCLETVASATGLVRLAREAMREDPKSLLHEAGGELTGKKVCEAAVEGDPSAWRVFDKAGRGLGIACGNLMNILNLEMIVIGGGVVDAGDLLLEPAIAEARAHSYPQTFEACHIVPAQLGTGSGIIGAALLARDLVG